MKKMRHSERGSLIVLLPSVSGREGVVPRTQIPAMEAVGTARGGGPQEPMEVAHWEGVGGKKNVPVMEDTQAGHC